ncbi:MAG: nucleoid-associated protein [Lachnospiraceae bacterium]
MVDFSNSKVLDLAVHIVGNKSKDEKIVLTETSAAIVDDVAEQYIKEYFFSSFNFELSYQFTHETSVNLNEIYIYSSAIFQSPALLVEQSINIAKHLYEVSTHPNIKKGELYVAYIKDCVIDGYKTNAIGIFKSETKDFYIDINHSKQSFSVSCKKGTNTKRLDKGCLIFDFEKKIPQKVYIVDSSRNDALYWKNDFLRVSEIEDAYMNTSNVLNICKKFVSKQPDLEKTSKVSFLNKSIQYFETHDNFEVDDFVTRLYNFINDTLVAESTVLGH